MWLGFPSLLGGKMLTSNVDSPQRKMSLVSVKKSGLGTPVLSGSCANFCEITDNGVGDYTITFTGRAIFTQIPEIMVGPKTVGIIKVHAVAKDSVQLKCYEVDGTTPAEMDFDILAMGSLARDLIS